MPVKTLSHTYLKFSCLVALNFSLVFVFLGPVEAEYQWPDQAIGAQEVPSAATVETDNPTPTPAVKLTLDGCLEQVKNTEGQIDPTSDAVRNCYKQWAGTANSPIQSFGIIRSIIGPGPCYMSQTVTLSDKGTMEMKTSPNPKATNCNRMIKEQIENYPLSTVNVEYFRSLLGMKILGTFQSTYGDPQVVEPTGTRWTFILNGQPSKVVDMKAGSDNSLPAELQAYLNSFNSIIVQTQNQ